MGASNHDADMWPGGRRGDGEIAVVTDQNNQLRNVLPDVAPAKLMLGEQTI
jgi:hypothetical protein